MLPSIRTRKDRDGGRGRRPTKVPWRGVAVTAADEQRIRATTTLETLERWLTLAVTVSAASELFVGDEGPETQSSR